jgi:hypothetical protein
MTKMYQCDPQLCATCSETVQQQEFRKVHLRGIGVDEKLKRRIVNPQAGALFGGRVNGGVR